MRKTLSFSLALMAAFSATSASAADVTEDLMISATVNNECSLLVTQLGGGEYNGLASGTQGYSNGALMVRCNQGTAFSIVPGDGLNYGAAIARPNHRAVSDGAGNFVAYGLFKDPGASQVWGSGADAWEGVGTGEQQMIGIGYAFYDLNKVPGGTFSDTIAVTLTY
ncbi:spore coat protein U domain-containing protein [Stenotrophomonas maltophilia]|jgi:spore coat protein U-like protein|uniref:SCPU domain-containing protein n=2 Tax=cellular organisms TaxID=131567 RepID=A0AAW3S594_STEMA|nr:MULTISPECIES: spore coat U domain-containing protein [Stenotrophomonas]EED39485.1 hypothetical protein SSKA14_2502 [Stenotrophomonas sp. SKA14]EKT2104489.1 spore coat protein U domain-containing protein [Stenotrophomonas maltophilia]EKT4074473.1 spore coat protein U domain-containing protein [Stenotrophomonas maltophilia]EKT4100101.1 spore coat protein U domain-containing protein [Stenotrophomonas maltophilia]EKU9961896.1 spore coat protein U domain-containing protein [Stenotrophomonas malt